MPNLRTRLSGREEAEDRKRLREMHHEGVEVEIPDDSECAPGLDISVIRGIESLIFNLPSGLAGYAIALRLVAGKPGLILLDCEITTSFDDQIVLECFDLGGPLCRLGRRQFTKSEVLNDCFPLKFHCGSMMGCVILATGLKPIPEEYLQGMMLPFKLRFWDQFKNEFSAEAELLVDRSTKPRRLGDTTSSLYGPEEAPATSEPAFGLNLNVGAVPNPVAGFLKKTGGRLS
jgi:hypothetical protein